MFRMATRLAAISLGALVGLGLAFQPSDAQPQAGGTVAFTGARIIDGTGKAPIEQGTIGALPVVSFAPWSAATGFTARSAAPTTM